MKTCARCGETKPVDEFPRDGKRRYAYCRPCKAAYMREYNDRMGSAWHLRRNLAVACRRLGITVDDYERMLIEQDGRCAICGTTDPGGRTERWPIDHDHDTGTVRGLLCYRCNSAIGLLDDDPDRIRRAAEYVGKFLTPVKSEA